MSKKIFFMAVILMNHSNYILSTCKKNGQECVLAECCKGSTCRGYVKWELIRDFDLSGFVKRIAQMGKCYGDKDFGNAGDVCTFNRDCKKGLSCWDQKTKSRHIRTCASGCSGNRRCPKNQVCRGWLIGNAGDAQIADKYATLGTCYAPKDAGTLGTKCNKNHPKDCRDNLICKPTRKNDETGWCVEK